jgi:hypothetical protein
MSQKSSVPQLRLSVSRALTPDKRLLLGVVRDERDPQDPFRHSLCLPVIFGTNGA